VEGHTEEGRHTTKLRTGIAEHPKVVAPEDTDFAKFYSAEKYPWRDRKIGKSYIRLEDRKRLLFEAECEDGTLHITIVIKVRPDSPPALLRFYPGLTEKLESDVLKAPELFPMMYEHFERVGNPVRRLEGMWAWDNYQDAKKVYDHLISGEAPMSSDEAAKIAVLHARTYVKYHRDRGFNQVVYAKHDAYHQVFRFLIERGD
jgi:hypothetical protein